jgi:hypothetical protein
MRLRTDNVVSSAVSIAARGIAKVVHLARLTVIAVIMWVRKIPTAGVTFGRLPWRSIVGGINSKRLRLIVALVLFVGWMAYLGYAALTKSRGPFVSHIQAAAASYAIVAEVDADKDGKPTTRVKVVEVLPSAVSAGGPAAGTECEVLNLQEVRGFEGRGQYLLLLVPDTFAIRNPADPHDIPRYYVVGQQRSPGNDLTGVGKPAIYRWNDDVRKQYEKLHQKSGPS